MEALRQSQLEESFHVARRVARCQLRGPLKRLLEPDDVAGEVVAVIAPKLGGVDRSLPAFVAHVTELWILDAHRRSRMLKRDVRRESTGWTNIGARDPRFPDAPVADDAHDKIVAEETRQRLMSSLDSDQQRIVAMKELGHSTKDAASAVGWNVRRAQRFLEDLRRRIAS